MAELNVNVAPFRVLCRDAFIRLNPGSEDDEWVDNLQLEPGDIVLRDTCCGQDFLVKAKNRNALADAIRRPE